MIILLKKDDTGKKVFDNSCKTVIKIFEVEDEAKLIYTYRGHTNLVHDLTWSYDDSLLMTCSSDFTTKIWNVPPYDPVNDTMDESISE